jgi:serine/threonine-protein kinase PknG
MTAPHRGCAERNCPGSVDPDGFCRLWGHRCTAATATPATPAPPAVRIRPTGRPWLRPAVIPPVAPRDPGSAVLAQAGHARYCPQSSCRTRLNLTSGFCPGCGTPYSFVPPLADGELRAGRYRIVGCLGHGGVGWVFLARDEAMDGIWRVLKGQRNPADREAAAAFVGERQALIALNHPRIVTITDALRESDTDAGYLVMEYVDGGSLEDARAGIGPDGAPAAVDVGQALGYAVQILDAFEYLHEQGWLYCDLKPDNVMLIAGHGVDGPLKLVDFGAARRIDNRVSPPWGTAGFEAPEVPLLGPAGPSVRSDIYTVGRTLAALTLTAHSAEVRSVPAGAELTGLGLPATHDPFVRLLARATATEPADRFGSAAEMREQVRGVRRQVRSAADGEPRPTRSTLFSPAACAFALHTDVGELDLVEILLGLPMPLVDGADPAAGFLASLGPAEPAELIALLEKAPERTAQVTYRMVRAHLAVGRVAPAEELLAALPADLRDWALWWHRGLVALVGGDTAAARRWFDTVYGWLPGEVSARLAYAVACELDDDLTAAAAHYRGVWDTDRGIVAAAFGLARCLRVTADPRRAAQVLLGMPEASRATALAVTCAVRILFEAPDDGHRLDAAVDAARVVTALPPFAERDLVEAFILRILLDCDLSDGRHADRRVLGHPLDERSVRQAFERRCRRLARRAGRRSERIALVDLANAERPVTWW